MSKLELLEKELFGDSNGSIRDIKFFPSGSIMKTTPEDAAGTILDSLEGIRKGRFRHIDRGE